MRSQGRGRLLFLFCSGVVTGFVALGCGGDDSRHTGKHDIFFMGAVIDGATGTPIKTYDITLVWGASSSKGKVDATTGRYTVGPIPAWNDYGVLINSDGYRTFTSYNPQIAPPTPTANSLSSDVYSADTTQTFNFDASLFPTALAPPDMVIAVIETGPNAQTAAGQIRLTPTSQPAIQSQPTEVAGQAWTNDADLYAGAISGMVTGGTFTAAGAALTYGVTYAVTVYGVDGFQPSAPTSVQAGVNTAASILLTPTAVPPIQLVANTVATCRAPMMLTDTSSALVTLTFNEKVEDGTLTAGGAAEALDNGVSFTDTLFTSQLAVNVSSTTQERGAALTISDNVVTLSWNPNVGLTTKGAGDVIRSVSYASTSLATIFLQPVGHPELRTSLAQLLGNVLTLGSITCSAP